MVYLLKENSYLMNLLPQGVGYVSSLQILQLSNIKTYKIGQEDKSGKFSIYKKICCINTITELMTKLTFLFFLVSHNYKIKFW